MQNNAAIYNQVKMYKTCKITQRKPPPDDQLCGVKSFLSFLILNSSYYRILRP